MKRLLTPASLVVACAFAAYLWLIHDRVSPYIGGSDSAGYYNGALLLREGRVATPQRIIEGLPSDRPADLFVPLGFSLRKSDASLVGGYPTGLSLLLIATSWFTGWEHVPGWTAGWHMLLGVILFYLLARRCGCSPGWASLGTAVLATSPLYLAMGLQPMTDVASLTWCTAAVLLALLAERHAAWTLASGFTFAFAVLIRPSNLILILPLSICLGLQWRRWLGFGLGGLPCAVFFAVYNYHAYGAILTTGYGNMSDAFKLQWLLPTLVHYVHWLPLEFTPLVALALFLPLHWKKSPRLTALLAVWAVTILAFYATYVFTHQVWWYLRFILPGIPPLLISALLVAENWTRKRRWPLFSTQSSLPLSITSAVLAMTLVAFNAFWVAKLNALGGKSDDGSYYKSATWLNENAAPNSVVLTMQSGGSTFAYTPFTVVRWDVLNPSITPLIQQSLADSKRPLYAVLYPFEEADAFARYPGQWREVYQYRWVKVFRYESSAIAPPAPTAPAPAS